MKCDTNYLSKKLQECKLGSTILDHAEKRLLLEFSREIEILVNNSYTEYYNYCISNQSKCFYPFYPGYRSKVKSLIYCLSNSNFLALAETEGKNKLYPWWAGSSGPLRLEDQLQMVCRYIKQFSKAEVLLLSPDDYVGYWISAFRLNPRVKVVSLSTLRKLAL